MSEPNFSFNYEKFYDQALWDSIKERYDNYTTPTSSPFEYKTSFDTAARLPYDIEGEVTDINETEWRPLYRWYQDRKRNEWYYQYKHFDEWFTLITITGEFLHVIQKRKNFTTIQNVSRTIKDHLDEKRFYKVERLY